MFDIFGEFNSAEEINLSAAGQREQGDKESLLVLAKENGIDEAIAECFFNGEIDMLVDDTSAAMGKIEIEKEIAGIKADFNFNDIQDSIISYLMAECMESTDFAKKVRSKGKSLNECFKHTASEIKKKLNSKNGGLLERTVFKFAKDYYME